MRNRDGADKQDCEINAGQRLIDRLRREHRQLPILANGDDLYAHDPFVTQLTGLRMSYVLVAKPDSHKELFDWIAGLERQGLTEHGQWPEGPAGQRMTYHYRIVRHVPLSAQRLHWVTFVELWQYDRHQKLCYHGGWVTDLPVTTENVATIIRIGRARWKIENEHFNVQKNHGYELEHNFGHGQRTLSMVFYLLNLLAFVAHVILDLSDAAYRECRTRLSRVELWPAVAGCARACRGS